MIKREISRDIPYFLLYTFIIPLICIIFIKYVPGCDDGILNLLLYGIESASPALAVIFVTLQTGGMKSLKQLLWDKYKNGFNIKYCFIGFLVPASIITVSKLLTYLTPYYNQFSKIPSGKKVLIISWALIAEELGWRGYLQDKVENKFGGNFTPLIVGGVWAIWHYHFWISGTMDVPIWVFTYGCIAESYGYYVITKLSKGNIIPASIWHFSGNLFFNLYLLNPNWNNGSIVPYTVVNLLYSIYICTFFIKKYIEHRYP